MTTILSGIHSSRSNRELAQYLRQFFSEIVGFDVLSQIRRTGTALDPVESGGFFWLARIGPAWNLEQKIDFCDRWKHGPV
jgi:hypothetical protein